MWYINIAEQTITFLLSLVMGCVFCLLYDCFRILRIIKSYSKTAIFIQDVLYWIICAFLCCCFLIIRCSGEIRGYVLVGALLGWVVFRLTLSILILALAKHILRFARWLYSKITKPVKAFLKFIRKKCRAVSKFFKNKALKMWNKTKKLLKRKKLMVYNYRHKRKAKKQREMSSTTQNAETEFI